MVHERSGPVVGVKSILKDKEVTATRTTRMCGNRLAAIMLRYFDTTRNGCRLVL